MIVVNVLMISCHVSTLRIRKTVGAQTVMRKTQNAKNAARLAMRDDHPANWSNGPTR
jgi:hypothetical protein